MFRSIYSRYVPGLKHEGEIIKESYMFIFDSNKILVKNLENTLSIPAAQDFEGIDIIFTDIQYLGKLDGHPCYCMESKNNGNFPDNMSFRELRSLLGLYDEDIFFLMGRAFQVMNWNRMNKYCGKCGAPTKNNENERSKICPRCGSIFYPRISPAVITAIVRDNKILLAHNRNFRPGRHSVIAGFVEIGETFEDCVKREIMEEVGVKVKNVKYFGSQPWPFPDSLMVGFTAEYDSGQICVDGVEIDHADWYAKDEFPEIPATSSIAGRLIRWFAENH